jgi:uridine phosphorylase
VPRPLHSRGFLDGPERVTDKRGPAGFIGTHEGTSATIQTTGVGAPSAVIVVEGLVRLGARNIPRVGSCGGYHPGMRDGDLVIATAAVPLVGVVGQL